MSKHFERSIDSNIYSRVMAARMSEHDRRTALHAMQTAEDVVDACVWLAGKIERLGALFYKPSLKH